MAVVIIVKDPEGNRFELTFPGKYTLGRSSSCDLPLKDTRISGKHAEISMDHEYKIYYKDLESTNGSFCLQKKITSTMIMINDFISFGNCQLYLDEKMLTPKEATHFQRLKFESKKEKTQFMATKMTHVQPNIISHAGQEEFELEESSGNTKLLKIDRPEFFKKNKS